MDKVINKVFQDHKLNKIYTYEEYLKLSKDKIISTNSDKFDETGEKN